MNSTVENLREKLKICLDLVATCVCVLPSCGRLNILHVHISHCIGNTQIIQYVQHRSVYCTLIRESLFQNTSAQCYILSAGGRFTRPHVFSALRYMQIYWCLLNVIYVYCKMVLHSVTGDVVLDISGWSFLLCYPLCSPNPLRPPHPLPCPGR